MNWNIAACMTTLPVITAIFRDVAEKEPLLRRQDTGYPP